MVEKVEALLLLLGLLGVLAVVAARLHFPFPILLVVAGVVIAFIPGLPEIRLDSQLVFILFLPPLIFSAAWSFPWEDFRANLVPIFGLAVGLVLVTMTAVAFFAHWLIPSWISLAAAFTLGAIISPPDAVAATSVLKKVRIPKRLSTILQGESLVNDSSGLVAYQFALAAVMTGTFSMQQASADFFWQSLGGIAVGYGIGMVVLWVHRGLNEPAVEVTLTILTPYVVYLLAEKIGCSGVLAVVAAGLHLGHRSWEALSSESRLERETIWKFIDYLLNGTVFILIGLQFPAIIRSLQGYLSFWELAFIGLSVSAVVIAVRFAWIFPMAFIQSLVLPASAGHRLKWGGLVVASWAGMRGVVSLAAALALPENFPHRHLIIFITFSVIFVTLVLQGLSLPWLVRKLKVEEDESEYESEARAKIVVLEHLVKELTDLIEAAPTEGEKASLNLWRQHYTDRVQHLHQRVDATREDIEEIVQFELKHFPTLLLHVRQQLAQLRRKGEISEEVRKRLEYDFDIEETRVLHLLKRYRAMR